MITDANHRRTAVIGLTGLAILASAIAVLSADNDGTPPSPASTLAVTAPDAPILAAIDATPESAAVAHRDHDFGDRGHPADLERAPIAGRLVTANGHSLAGRMVGWQPVTGNGTMAAIETPVAASITASSDAEGRFLLQVPSFVRGRLQLAERRFAFESTPKAQTITAAGIDVGDLVVVAAATLHGVTLDRHGHPVADAHVRIDPRGSRGDGRTTHTSLDGSFRVEGLRPGPYRLIAESSRFLTHRLAFEIPADEDMVELRLELAAGRTLPGRVIDDLGRPLAGARVALAAEHPDRPGTALPRFGDPVETDAGGGFLLPGVADLGFTVMAWDDHHGAAVANFAGATDGLVLQVDRHGSVSGRLADPSNRPLAGSQLRLSRQWPEGADLALHAEAARLSSGGTERTATSDGDGRFEFANVPAGDWQLRATGPTHLATAAVTVSVRPGAASQVTLLGDRGNALVVHVEDARGNPLAGATVSLFEADDRRGGAGFLLAAEASDAAGQAELDHLPIGAFIVEARHDLWAPSEPVRVDVAIDAATLTLRLQAGAFVEIVARSDDGAPRAGIACCALTADGSNRVAWRGRTDADGRARSTPLVPGQLVVALLPDSRGVGSIDPDRARRGGTAVAVAAGEVRRVELIAARPATLRGTVSGPLGAEADAEVRVVPLRGSERSFFVTRSRHITRSDRDGNYSISGLADGRYRVQFGRPGQPFRFEQELQIVAGQRDYVVHCAMRTGKVEVVVRATTDRATVDNAIVVLSREALPGAVAYGSSVLHGDGSGLIRATDLVPGRYALTVRAEGYATTEVAVEVVPGGVTGQTIELLAARPATADDHGGR
ncbi:MAG: carboxypeptidase regulatory-like domain-containing protein [Planctomycetes bacterium]|nr:carboxypeptidase regulatory-like domain-containing protein [Planctomycetota bacterium]